MKILIAVDANAYSRYAVNQAARIAANTWPDVVMLAVEGASDSVDEDFLPLDQAHPKIGMLRKYREDFLEAFGPDAEMYTHDGVGEMRQISRKVVEEDVSGRKSFLLHVRSGNPFKSILAEAGETQSDMIVLGCDQHGCEWGRYSETPGKVAEAAQCSVLVIKEDLRPSRVVCCLDHAAVTQESLELINQLVTLYGAELEIVGVLKRGELQEQVEQKMGEVLDYYLTRNVRALIRVVDEQSLESFIAAGGRDELMAIWLSPKSPLQRIFLRDKVSSLVARSLSSILLLR